MFKILVILFFIFMNFIMCRVYAMIARKKFINKTNENKITDIQAKNKRRFCLSIKSYILALFYFTLRFVSVIPSFRIRAFLYKNIFLMQIGKYTKIRGFVEILAPWNIEIGENTMIGQGCKLDGRNGLYIGNNVNISDSVAIWTEQHDIQSPNFECNGGKVIISDKVWISYQCTILPECNIGEGCVLAAGAIAVKNLDKFSLYAGIPACRIKDRNNNLEYSLNIDYMHGY